MESKQQHIVARALIECNDKILLIKRSDTGLLSGKFELPGGQVEFSESAEQALGRELKEETGWAFKDPSLYKTYAFTYNNIHVIGICYKFVLTDYFEPILNPLEHSMYVWASKVELNNLPITEETELIMKLSSSAAKASKINQKVKLYTDGGSRGNPGPSALGYVIYDATTQEQLAEGQKYLGITTNNQAEYQAVKAGLQQCNELGAAHVDVFLDSQLVANQMNGIYKIKNRDLWPIHDAIKKIAATFKEGVSYTYIPRELNKEADARVNEALDTAEALEKSNNTTL